MGVVYCHPAVKMEGEATAQPKIMPGSYIRMAHAVVGELYLRAEKST